VPLRPVAGAAPCRSIRVSRHAGVLAGGLAKAEVTRIAVDPALIHVLLDQPFEPLAVHPISGGSDATLPAGEPTVCDSSRPPSIMARIKIGVVGCGLIAQMMHLPHLRELADAYEVVALCAVSPPTLKHVADHYDIGRRFTDYRYLLKDEVEAIAVLSPDS